MGVGKATASRIEPHAPADSCLLAGATLLDRKAWHWMKTGRTQRRLMCQWVAGGLRWWPCWLVKRGYVVLIGDDKLVIVIACGWTDVCYCCRTPEGRWMMIVNGKVEIKFGLRGILEWFDWGTSRRHVCGIFYGHRQVYAIRPVLGIYNEFQK